MDLTAIGTQEVTPEQWYASVVGSLSRSFQLDLNLRSWWRDRTHLSLVNRLSEFIESRQNLLKSTTVYRKLQR
jgi:hypothetical protein